MCQPNRGAPLAHIVSGHYEGVGGLWGGQFLWKVARKRVLAVGGVPGRATTRELQGGDFNECPRAGSWGEQLHLPGVHEEGPKNYSYMRSCQIAPRKVAELSVAARGVERSGSPSQDRKRGRSRSRSRWEF